jgi:hypothetical protein
VVETNKILRYAHLIEALMDVRGFTNICGWLMFDDSRNLGSWRVNQQPLRLKLKFSLPNQILSF